MTVDPDHTETTATDGPDEEIATTRTAETAETAEMAVVKEDGIVIVPPMGLVTVVLVTEVVVDDRPKDHGPDHAKDGRVPRTTVLLLANPGTPVVLPVVLPVSQVDHHPAVLHHPVECHQDIPAVQSPPCPPIRIRTKDSSNIKCNKPIKCRTCTCKVVCKVATEVNTHPTNKIKLIENCMLGIQINNLQRHN